MTYPVGVRLANVVRPYSLEYMQNWIDWVKVAGFEVVDVPILTQEIKTMVDAAGLSVGSFDVQGVSALFSKDEAKRSASAESIRKQIRDAAEWGGKICFMCLLPEDPTMTRAESFKLFKEVFPGIAEEAERQDVKIVFEGYPGPDPYYPALGCTPETLRAMFEAVPSPSLCVNYDPSHLLRLGVDYIRFLREFSDRIGHVHGKDCAINQEDVYLYGRNQSAAFGQPVKFSLGPWRYTIPGEGEVNWALIAFELDRANYKGAVCIELEDHRYAGNEENHRRGFKKAGEYLSKLFS